MVINEGFSKIEAPSSCVDTNPRHSPIGLGIWERWRGWKILSFNECLRWKSEIFGITRRRWQLWCSYDNFTSLQTWFLSVQHRGPSSLHRATGFLSTSPGVTSSLWIHRKSDYFTIGSSILIRSHFATFSVLLHLWRVGRRNVLILEVPIQYFCCLKPIMKQFLQII